MTALTDDFLSAVRPFDTMSVVERTQLLRGATAHAYVKGSTVFREGAQSDAVWVVKTGRVHLTRYQQDGKAGTLCVIAPRETFCCLPTLDRGAYPADAVVAEDSVVLRISLELFHKTLQSSPQFLQHALCHFCDRLRQVEDRGCMVYESVEQRLAKVLLGLEKKFGASIPLTRQELAEIAGTTHETAIRVLSRLKEQGIVSSSRGQTTILSSQKLADLCA